MRVEAHNTSSSMSASDTGISGRCLLVLAGLLVILASIPPAPAEAAPPPTFWTRCVANTTSPSDVACATPRGIATAPASAAQPGAVYVADQSNRRIVEFSPWGEFVKAWGWDVVQSGPGNTGVGFEICRAADGDVCKQGSAGPGSGQFGFASPQGVAVDSAGNVYVVDRGLPSNQRVQKFDPEGNFLRMWGKEVNSGTAANKEICTAAGPPEQICQAGGEGTGPGQFGEWPVIGSYIAIDTAGTGTAVDDRIYVGDEERIQEFDSEGGYVADLPDPEGLLAGKTVRALATYPNGSLIVARAADGESFLDGVLRLNAASGGKECEIPTSPTAVLIGAAADEAGNVFLTDGTKVRRYGSDCAEVSDGTYPFEGFFSTESTTGLAIGQACFNSGFGLYASRPESSNFIRAYGPAPDNAELCPAPAGAPEIDAQWARLVESDLAAVQAEIDPVNTADTAYYVQYGTVACVAAGGWAAPCVAQRPAAPAPLGAGVVNEGVKTAKVQLTGLAPATEYSYRFAAESSNGGPVFGVGGTEAEDGAAASFTTRAIVGPPAPDLCPNRGLRSGPAAALPDCRAYELVSPVDKNGGEIVNNVAFRAIHDAYIQSRADGGKITYSAAPSFGDQLAARHQNQYIATRGAGGWSNHGINAPLGAQPGDVIPLDNLVGPFSADLCSSWLADRNLVPLRPDAQAGFTNLYRRQNCEPGEGSFETLTTAPPPVGTERDYVSHQRKVQGFSADGTAAFFVARAALTSGAAAGTQVQIYLHLAGQTQLRLVSILPSGVAAAPGAGSELGGAASGAGNLDNAVSADGRRAFWTAHSAGNTSAGSVYLRENPAEPQSALEAGACTEPARACTVPVSAGAAATFWDATPDGSAAIYTEGDLSGGAASLFRFDTASRTRTKIAEGVYGLAGASEDLSRIYLVSSKASAPGATLGQPNLYLLEGGGFSFVGTLLPGDVTGGTVAKVTTTDPFERATRVTPDGGSIVFQSRASLTGFDNADADSGELDIEVFTYAAGGEVQCVSCNPAGVRPAGRELPTPYVYPHTSVFDPATQTGVGAAAWIPTWENPLHASRVISEDGERIFFNSNDALLPADGNGAQDVYQWEAPGKGSCRVGEENHFAQNGGCLSLISSGESAFESEFWEASASGDDVFFTTESSLVAEDPGLIDLYDARVEGGFPAAEQRAACEGEACQSPPPAPAQAPRSSSSYRGPANAARSCRPAARRAARLSRRAKRLRRNARRVGNAARTRQMRGKAKRYAGRARSLSRNAKRCRRANRRAGR